MDSVINIGILGAGNIAGAMAEAVSGIPQYARLYAVGSRNIDKARGFSEKWNIPRFYGSYEELSEDKNIDLIYIATPHSEHYKNTKLCLMNGKNCLVEKAFCSNLTQTDELIALAREKNLLLSEAMWTRFQPSATIIKGIVSSGIIGNINFLEDNFSIQARGVKRLEQPSLSGGALLDLGVYSLTTARLFLGTDIVSVKAKTTLNEYGVDLHDEIVMTYGSGAVARVRASFGGEVSNYARIEGEKGYMTFAPINAPETYSVYDSEGNSIMKGSFPFIVNGYEYQVIEIRNALLNGLKEAPSMPLSETRAMMGWMDSIRSHFGVKYPFEKEEDINHPDIEIWGRNNIW